MLKNFGIARLRMNSESNSESRLKTTEKRL